MLRHPLLKLAFTATLIAAGCTGVNKPIEPRMDPYIPSQIHMDSDQLRRDTAVGTPNPRRDENGLLFVTLPVRSAIDKTLYVDYYVTWFDKNGQPLGERMGPHTITLDPNTPSTITVNATSPRAVDFQIDMRYAR